MALSASREVVWDGVPELDGALVNGNDTYYVGAVLVRDGATGYLTVPSDAAALEGAGVFDGNTEEGKFTEYDVANGSHPRVQLKKGRVWLPFGSAAQTDVGDLGYLADDQSLTKTAGSKTIGYRILDYKSGYLLIDLRSPIKLS